MEVPLRRRQKVDRMKKMEIQMINLLRMNMPTEHSISEMKLVPSAYYWEIRRVGSYSRMFDALFLLIINNIYRKITMHSPFDFCR